MITHFSLVWYKQNHKMSVGCNVVLKLWFVLTVNDLKFPPDNKIISGYHLPRHQLHSLHHLSPLLVYWPSHVTIYLQKDFVPWMVWRTNLNSMPVKFLVWCHFRSNFDHYHLIVNLRYYPQILHIMIVCNASPHTQKWHYIIGWDI